MSKEQIKKIYISIFSLIMACFVAFYFLAGDSIKYRDSRRNISVTDANKATRDITRDVVVQQNFYNLIDRLKRVSIECTTLYRTNNGKVTIGVYDGNEFLFGNSYYVNTIKEGDVLVAEADDYIEGKAGKELSIIITSTSTENYSLELLTNTMSTAGTFLHVGDVYMAGSLCFTASGQEFIFTGQHYWEIAGGICSLFGLILLWSYHNYIRGKRDYLVVALNAVNRYEFLISQLVKRDFKTKYKRSVLGVFWSFLNPLMTMTVQYIVFSTLFRSNIESYAVYLLTGIIAFSFFNEVTTMCLQSITGNANLIKKVYMPKYIFHLSRTISSGVNLLISLIPLILICLITGVALKQSVILALYFLTCLVVFALGVGMFLSALMVFFRDIQFLWSVVVMMWQYATPIFYAPEIIPAKFAFILRFNPIYHFIKNIRLCVINGISPEPRAYAYCFVFALGSLLLGSLVFKKSQDKFTLYL